MARMPQTRNTQEQRSSISRAAMIDAALECLDQEGLASTTTVRIQEKTGFSRGRLLHHFASRVELLVAAVQNLAQGRFSNLKQPRARASRVARIEHAIRTLWLTHDGVLFWAAMELWIGARTNPSLATALRGEEKRLGVLIRKAADDLFGEDLCSGANYVNCRELLISSMRGVALTYTFSRRRMESDPHIEMWCEIARRMLISSRAGPGEAHRERAAAKSP
jgi:AcrR family transcriptional regulator